jgi:hypothetical protein
MNPNPNINTNTNSLKNFSNSNNNSTSINSNSNSIKEIKLNFGKSFKKYFDLDVIIKKINENELSNL